MNMMQRIEAQLLAPFDYGQLEPEVAQEARSVAARYRSRVQAYVIDTGRDLLAMKERLDHGQFLSWVKAEMGLTPRTAQNFMQAAAQLGHKCEIVSHLPPTTLYRLAASSTPAHVREDIVRRLEAHESLPPKTIEAMVEDAKEKAKRRAAEEKEAARWAALSPEQQAAEAKHRKSRARRKAEREVQLNRERAEREKRARAEAAEREVAALFLVEKMGKHLPRFLQLAKASGWVQGVITRAEELAGSARAAALRALPVPADEPMLPFERRAPRLPPHPPGTASSSRGNSLA
ncbi:DUF3102 domain-containing protein [Methylobacterium nigriterrae]|uniref:DUF3102 domain-containing protein n=1 Tax=Methylobacterium nigriterrae TaxID=3127512 RepID=UPI0030139F92